MYNLIIEYKQICNAGVLNKDWLFEVDYLSNVLKYQNVPFAISLNLKFYTT